MKLAKWNHYFAPHILSRGRAYFDSDLVEIEAMDEQSIEASVEGTETYSVEILFQKGQVVQMTCDCPYAVGGENCKHMAAVLFAAEAELADEACEPESSGENADTRTPDPETELRKVVDSLPEERLRSYLLDAAKKHQDLRDRLMMSGKQAVSRETKRRWRSSLARMTRKAADPDGFIDYDRAYDYTCQLGQFLDESIAPLLENHLVMDAFELVGMVFTEATDQDMDDSDGGLSELTDWCYGYWRELIPSPEADQGRMLDWFEEQIRQSKGGVKADFLWPMVYELFTDAALLPRVLALVDREIESARGYALQDLIEHRIALMEGAGASADEVEAYKKRFWAQPFIRKQEMDRLEAENQWKEALALLKVCEEMDREDRSLRLEYSVRRIRILKQAGPEWAYVEALKSHVFGFPQRDLTVISELKQAVPEEQWPELLQQLFQNENTQGLRRQLQLSEGMLEQMMTELEASRFSYELRQYEKDLRKVFPERVRDLLLRQLDEEMRRASTRSAYASVARSVKHLYGYPEGREKAAELAKAWRRDFPRRSAMLEELKKVKL